MDHRAARDLYASSASFNAASIMLGKGREPIQETLGSAVGRIHCGAVPMGLSHNDIDRAV